MLIQNGKLLLDGDFVYRDLRLEGDRIAEILPFGSEPREGEEVMDVYGSAITPGFIDLEVHGALGHDFSDGDREGYEIISKSLLRNGVTGYLAAVNAFPVDVLEDTYRALGDWMDDPAQNAARITFGNPKLLDVVICRYPARGAMNFVKRVTGMPGDTVELRDGYLYLNGDEQRLSRVMHRAVEIIDGK